MYRNRCDGDPPGMTHKMAPPGGVNPAAFSASLQPEQKKLRILIHSLCKIDDGTLLADVDLRKYAAESGQAVTNGTVQELCAVHPHIDSLNLTNCSQVSDAGLWALAKHCTKIQRLTLYGCSKISHVGLRAISLKCSGIIDLDLSHCNLMDDMTLTVLAGGSWKIRRLSLQYCTQITDTGVARVAVGMSSHLQLLNVNGCPNIGEFGDRGLKEIGSNCPNIEELYMGDTKRIEDPGCVNLAIGSPNLRVLQLSGCENLTKKTLRAFAQNFQRLQELKLVWNRKLQDLDYGAWTEEGVALQRTLKVLELQQFESLSDKGVGAICKALGNSLTSLTLSSCPLLTDYSAMIVSHLCPKLRALDLTYCGRFTDDAVHHLAQRMTALTSLRLDGNTAVTNKCLMRYVGREFEFVDMANQWIGYQPRPRVDDLIAKKEEFILHTAQAVKIQSMLRKRFAHRLYWERYRERLLTQVVPLFQARVRGYFQRKRFGVVQQQLHRIRMATRLQSKWRNYYALHERLRVVKRQRWERHCNAMALTMQRVYRGHCGRTRVSKIRTDLVNTRIEASRKQAAREVAAARVQRVFRGCMARGRAVQLNLLRQQRAERAELVARSRRLIQRVARGKIGRIRAQQRRDEIAHWERRWQAAWNIQRVFRGHQGRQRFLRFLKAELLRRRNVAVTHIQRHFRGYRGRLLGAVARALKGLRTQHQFYALEIQRFLRGCMGRHYFALHKERVTRHRRHCAAALVIQRLYRGHKGREAREIETQLQSMDHRAKPLLDHLRKLEDEANKLRVLIRRLEGTEQRMREDVAAIERELEQCVRTTSKYTDSARINGIPQRFLTKFLKVRLADHLEHEEEVHRQKNIELQSRRADLRDAEYEIMIAQRELVPLTTGLIAEVKRRRVQALRDRVRRKRWAATAIQALMRRALVRCALYDEHKEFWVSRVDRDQSDQPYYLNVMSKEITWRKPLAFRFFGNRVQNIPAALM